MARTNIRALRFAEAAFAVARDAHQLDAWLEALEQASSVYDDHAAGLFLTSPVVPPEKKQAVLSRAAAGRLAGGAAASWRSWRTGTGWSWSRRSPRSSGGCSTSIAASRWPRSPRPSRSTSGRRRSIAARLGQRLGKTVMVETRVDPEILGGVIAQIGDNVIDGSVRGRLERLRRALTA